MPVFYGLSKSAVRSLWRGTRWRDVSEGGSLLSAAPIEEGRLQRLTLWSVSGVPGESAHARSRNVPGNNAACRVTCFSGHSFNMERQNDMRQYSEDHLLLLQELKRVTSLGKSTIYNYGNPKNKYYHPDFPKRRKRGRRGVGWLASEVFAWVATRD